MSDSTFNLARQVDASTPILPGEQKNAASVTIQFRMNQ